MQVSVPLREMSERPWVFARSTKEKYASSLEDLIETELEKMTITLTLTYQHASKRSLEGNVRKTMGVCTQHKRKTCIKSGGFN
jgi:hypothetical protein